MAFRRPCHLARLFTTATESCSIKPKDKSPIGYLVLKKPVPYDVGLALQAHLVSRRHHINRGHPSKDPKDIVCFLEHPPTYTSGRRMRNTTTEEEESRLRSLGADYYETMRGGQVTYHGPGQLVTYPVFDIRDHQLNVRCFVSRLEKTIIAACAKYNIQANTTENTGVWVGEHHKIAAIGVQLQRYVSSHGVALNCNTNLDWFSHIVPCGLAEKKPTSISAQRQCETTVQDVVPVLVESFEKMFCKPLVPLQKGELMEEINAIVYK